MPQGVRPEWFHKSDYFGQMLNQIERAMNSNRNHVGSVLLAEATRVRSELPKMQAADLFFDGEYEVLVRCFKEFDHYSDFTRDLIKGMLRQLYPLDHTQPPDWVVMTEQRRSLYRASWYVRLFFPGRFR